MLCVAQELFRTVHGFLNKLRAERFNQLMKQVKELHIDTEERLKGVVELIFEKAIDEPNFSVGYGIMCKFLAAYFQVNGETSARATSGASVKLDAVPDSTTHKPALSEEEIEKRSKSIIEEFLHINNYKEMISCSVL
ncbi:eukaryotic translation initiation factor 4 gamma 3 isoform X8 [Silurus asotus]|uniref:Eukaryotic translation initiation factor 4 gamma 3 isoform X8 n=1 Tax=Silurus asotus TaxID=30991 RepID=A0AAD5A4X2_SILAS|nr:eukaryotic translation initiation factor 4 gamma 3 isoform X8 [Silurus asotus]